MPDDPTFGRPENQSLPDGIVDVKESLFAADLTMVSFFCLLEHIKPILQVFCRGEGRAIDALKLGISFVTLIEGARNMCQAEGANFRSVGNMRSGA